MFRSTQKSNGDESSAHSSQKSFSLYQLKMNMDIEAWHILLVGLFFEPEWDQYAFCFAHYLWSVNKILTNETEVFSCIYASFLLYIQIDGKMKKLIESGLGEIQFFIEVENNIFMSILSCAMFLIAFRDDLRDHLKNVQRQIMQQRQPVMPSDSSSSSSSESESESSSSSSSESSSDSSSGMCIYFIFTNFNRFSM